MSAHTLIRRLVLPALALAFALVVAPVHAEEARGASPRVPAACADFVTNDYFSFDQQPETAIATPVTPGCNCVCSTINGPGFWCYRPDLSGPWYELLPAGCNPEQVACSVKATLRARFPGNSRSIVTAGGGGDLLWFNSSGVAVGMCGGTSREILTEEAEFYTQRGGFRCRGTGGEVANLTAQICDGATLCTRKTQNGAVNFTDQGLSAIFCKKPPMSSCCMDSGCKECVAGLSLGGGGACASPPNSGPGAHLAYLGGGVGQVGFPGSAEWNQTLGRGWSHTYAERIVRDPDDSHVFLLTRWATFREFRDLVPDAGGLYEETQPSDEKRRLRKTATGWELGALDGSKTLFDGQGRWDRSLDKNGNETRGFYDVAGRLERVEKPDGRRELFAYHPSGKLASITEVGIGDPAPARTWTYSWLGQDLMSIGTPDGRGLRFVYGGFGYLSLMVQLANDGDPDTPPSERGILGFNYDADGNAYRSFKGGFGFSDANATEKWEITFTGGLEPTAASAKDPLNRISTYTIGRDPVSRKPRVESMVGDCPVCGSGSPEMTYLYQDAANPLRATREIDAEGVVTLSEYDAFGMKTSETEAFGTARERTTEWDYHADFPAFVTATRRPSSSGSGLRETTRSYNATNGNLETHTETGAEATYPGGLFNLSTTTTYNPQGQPLTIDPPGYGTADVTSFTYDPLRGNLIPLSRTDPLIGATTFGYDGFHRRTSVTDPNGLTTVTAYDPLNRVTEVRQLGATPAEDLVTRSVYNPFGDLFCVVLPRGNALSYIYDAAGRLLESLQGTAVASPTGTSCLNSANSQIRKRYTLNAAGQRTNEKLERYSSGTWTLEAETSFTYASRCHLDKVTQAPGRTEQSVTEYAYDCNGRLKRLWDGNHPSSNQTALATTTYDYDELDRLLSVTQPWGGAGGGTVTTRYGYDVQDHLRSVTDGERNVTTFTTSDRDLMTAEVSTVSGTTTHVYNDHGEMTRTTDARGVVVNRTVDALDRVTLVDYPTNALDVGYVWDDPEVPFSKGRLTRIARSDSEIIYRHDRFGRLTQDGQLGYSYDVNGNRTAITYPGGVTASTTYDFGDRPLTLTATGPSAGQTQTVVTQGLYKPYGPTRSVTLGNGKVETRNADFRYAPTSIATGSNFTWNFTTDKVGNVTELQQAGSPQARTFTYQDFQYYLTSGVGPWGTRGWTYDRIGNRLTETTAAGTDTYSYRPNTDPVPGNTPTLSSIALAGGTGTKSYTIGPAGHLSQVNAAGNQILFNHDDAGQLGGLERPAAAERTAMSYDGRGFLIAAVEPGPAPPPPGPPGSPIFSDGFETGDVCRWTVTVGATPPPTCPKPPQPLVEAVYSSDGVLHKLSRELAPEEIYYFHFYGRPVAQLEVSGTTRTWKWITVDHLGTPFQLTNSAGTELWSGGLEPFGRDWREGTTSSALAKNLMLRLPGQWEEQTWADASLGAGVFYNVHRFLEPQTGRYLQPDPDWNPRRSREINRFLYVAANPLAGLDPLGLRLIKTCCNDWDKQHLPQLLRQVADLQAAFINRTALPRSLGFGPHGVTTCELLRLPGPGHPQTAYRAFGQGACADACTRVHEQSHRDECKRADYFTLETQRSSWVGEALAYAKHASCLTRAIFDGSVEVDVDPFGPDNYVE